VWGFVTFQPCHQKAIGCGWVDILHWISRGRSGWGWVDLVPTCMGAWPWWCPSGIVARPVANDRLYVASLMSQRPARVCPGFDNRSVTLGPPSTHPIHLHRAAGLIVYQATPPSCWPMPRPAAHTPWPELPHTCTSSWTRLHAHPPAQLRQTESMSPCWPDPFSHAHIHTVLPRQPVCRSNCASCTQVTYLHEFMHGWATMSGAATKLPLRPFFPTHLH
jgi:hypothetical protein